MKKNLLFLLLLALFTQAAVAIPAKPGLIKITQADGSALTIELHGDEFFNYTTTADGYQVKQAQDGNYYYFTPSSATRAAVQMQAHDPINRTAAERAFLSTITVGGDINYISQGRMNAMARRAQLTSILSAKQSPTKSTRANAMAPKGLVIVVQYSDVKLQPGRTIADFTALLNTKGYSLNGGTGSSRDFYNESSMGNYNPEFVVCPQVITLPKPRKFYGENNANGDDGDPRQMIIDACMGANPYVNFSDYDTDGNGMIDNVFVYYAGNNPAEGGPDDAIWPHRWAVEKEYIFDGVRLFDYACTSECRGAEKTILAGIGTFTHEFGHVLGLPDLYDTDGNGSGGDSPGLYAISTMCAGSYNNDGNTPPYFTALERWILEWNSVKVLPTGTISIKPIDIENDAWVIPTKDPNEFYLIEARSNKQHWDKTLGGYGLLIYHIDQSANHIMGGLSAKRRWETNAINNVPESECAKLIESGGYNVSIKGSQMKLFYPGTGNVTQFTASTYGGKDNGGYDLKYDLTNITWDGSQITLTATRTDIAAGIKGVKSTYTVGESFTPLMMELAEVPTSVEWIIGSVAVPANAPYVFQSAGKIAIVCKVTYTDTSIETITRTVEVL